ncbi:hypothetical protein ACFY6U_51295 [Streptomyces sp. NPDC013157]|uniref:hypothetical protein n=1 Tax=Streptomyces sp. NPDC013157 TaxID=3364861 RepID=UPI00369984EA
MARHWAGADIGKARHHTVELVAERAHNDVDHAAKHRQRLRLRAGRCRLDRRP